jgi:hypothetical protein
LYQGLILAPPHPVSTFDEHLNYGIYTLNDSGLVLSAVRALFGDDSVTGEFSLEIALCKFLITEDLIWWPVHTPPVLFKSFK